MTGKWLKSGCDLYCLRPLSAHCVACREISAAGTPTPYLTALLFENGKAEAGNRGFIKLSESTADVDPGSLDVKSLAKRSLRIVKICLDTNQVSADDLVDDVPEELAEEVVTQKADEYE